MLDLIESLAGLLKNASATYCPCDRHQANPFGEDEEIYYFECEKCLRIVCYRCGGDGDELCNECWANNENP